MAKDLLKLLDGFFKILNNIWKYNFFDNEYVNKIFHGAIIVASSWLVIKIMIELIMNYMVKGESRDTPVSVYRGAILAVVMMFFISPLYDYGYKFSVALTTAVNSVSNIESTNVDSKISNVILNATFKDDSMEKDDADYFLKHWKTIDINETRKESAFGKSYYKYSVSMIILIIIVLVTIVLFFFLAVQMAKRVLELALYKIIGPFCCTSLTSEKSKSFEVWVKGSLGLFLITVVQFVGIGLLINMFGSTIRDNGMLTSIFLLIGALIFIISSPTIINSLLEQQSGVMGGFYDIQTLLGTTHMIGSGMHMMGSATKMLFRGGSGLANFVKKGFSGFNSGSSGGDDGGLKESMREARESGTQFNKAPYIMNNFRNNSSSNSNRMNRGLSNPNSYSHFYNNNIRPYNLSYNSMNNQYSSKINHNNNGG